MRRHGARYNSILNSPVVRALVKPITIPTPVPEPLPTSPTTTLNVPTSAAAAAANSPAQDDPAPPSSGHLISTQPSSSAPRQPTAVAVSPPLPAPAQGSPAKTVKKRKRGANDDGEEERAADAPVQSAALLPQEVTTVPPVVREQQYHPVEVAYHAGNVPPELQKYWAQRYRLFSLFDSGVQMDLEGWYSVTPELVAVQIAERCRSGVVLDAFCGVGGNAIQFAFTCERVIALDTSATRLACARHNAEIYGVADRITFLHTDYIDFSNSYAARKKAGTLAREDEIDVVFLSPPWGGIEYLTAGGAGGTSAMNDSPAAPPPKRKKGKPPAFALPPSLPPYPLEALAPLPGQELFSLARGITKDVAMYLPRNQDLGQIAELAGAEKVEVEEAWMGNKMKAVTCYFGALAVGAGDGI